MPTEFYSRPPSTVGLNPWAAPGTAPVYGEGCGVNGGNPFPNGCNQPNADPNPYGTCCSKNPGGKNYFL